ncbi:hypothetical protein HQ545_07310 [Candidatus Woesearchaeota archaeon]|nr:hypothetical protein [Candidatus Woesearchaeota archaeon]
MNRFVILLLALAGTLLFLSGCGVTGSMSHTLDDEIIGCSLNTEIEFLKIDGDVRTCVGEEGMYLAVDNTGTSMISGLAVSVDYGYDVTMHLRGVISPGETKQHRISFGSTGLPGTTSVTVYPMLGDFNQNIICGDAVIRSEIGEC